MPWAAETWAMSLLISSSCIGLPSFSTCWYRTGRWCTRSSSSETPTIGGRRPSLHWHHGCEVAHYEWCCWWNNIIPPPQKMKSRSSFASRWCQSTSTDWLEPWWRLCFCPKSECEPFHVVFLWYFWRQSVIFLFQFSLLTQDNFYSYLPSGQHHERGN